MVRLSASADLKDTSIESLGYAREHVRAGQLHIGVGQFHRAHQAVYADDLLRRGATEWGIVGASLKTPTAHNRLEPQAGLYTLQVMHAEGVERRLIGSLLRVIDGSDPTGRDAVIGAFADPSIHIVTLTVTEKGYDADLAQLLCAGLEARRLNGGRPISMLSCDNLSANGHVLARLIDETAAPVLRDWIATSVSFPCTMVDRIAPQVSDAHKTAFERATGIEDHGLTLAEPFRQWVIEDRFAGPRPDWASVGIELVADVAPYEAMKLALLNGAHSAAAYLGRRSEHTYIHEVMADDAAREFLTTLISEEVIPVTEAPPGVDLAEYWDQVFERFANPAVPYLCTQVATDGSQKLPQRWMPIIERRLAQGLGIDRFAHALAAWIEHLADPAPDPLAPRLKNLFETHRDPEALVRSLFDETPVFQAVAAYRDRVEGSVADAVERMRSVGIS